MLPRREWSGKRGSNSRPPPWQGGALPLSYFRMTLTTKIILAHFRLPVNTFEKLFSTFVVASCVFESVARSSERLIIITNPPQYVKIILQKNLQKSR